MLFLKTSVKKEKVLYSGVPNKRGVRIIGGGWKWFNITVIGGAGIIGGGLGEIENSRFLR